MKTTSGLTGAEARSERDDTSGDLLHQGGPPVKLEVRRFEALGREDKPMIEAQQLRIGDADLLDCCPALMVIDNASIRARRIYRHLVETG